MQKTGVCVLFVQIMFFINDRDLSLTLTRSCLTNHTLSIAYLPNQIATYSRATVLYWWMFLLFCPPLHMCMMDKYTVTLTEKEKIQ